jgi:preprotein translocase subunit SecE
VTEKTAKQPNPVTKYFREVRGELKKVTWPTPQESRRLTLIVVAVTIAFAIFLFFWDWVFSNLVQQIIQLLAG